MSMIVQHNLVSMNANRNLGVSCGNLAKSTERLSSGYKINRAGDNAAGLAISEKMRGQIRGLNQASANSEDGISMIQTAEGALTETHSILQRMRELAVQASSDTNTDDDRTQIQNEIDQLTQEVDRIATTTEFNTKKLLDGSRTGSVTEKAGKASVEGTFGNSNVSAEITTNGADKAAFTDVIRVEITQDFKAGQSIQSAAGKYSDAELDAVFALITADTAVSTALTTAEGTVTTAQTALETAQSTFETKQSATETAMGTIAGKATAATAGLAAGVTQKEFKAAVEEYVSALVNGGQGTTIPTLAAGNEAFDKLMNVLAGGSTNGDWTGGAKLKDAIEAEAKARLDVIKNQKALDVANKNVAMLSDDKLMDALLAKKKADEALANDSADSAEGTEILKANVTKAEATLKEANKGGGNITITDLFGNGNDTTKFEIASKVADDGTLTINLKNKEGSDTVITISNADKLKAGDVITVTAEKMVESKQAATGKEAFRLQVGANAGQEVALGINSMRAKDLEIVQTKEGVEGKGLDVTNQATASLAVNAYDMAIQKVSTERAKMGAMQNRLEHTIANLDASAENLQAAESSLRDTDMAEEMTQYSKNNILMQAGQSMLAQANQSNQGVLSLLG